MHCRKKKIGVKLHKKGTYNKGHRIFFHPTVYSSFRFFFSNNKKTVFGREVVLTS